MRRSLLPCCSPSQPFRRARISFATVPLKFQGALNKHPLAAHAAGLASWFSLVPIPGTMQLQMLLLAGGAFAAATAIERGARAAFPASLPPEKGGLVARSGSRAALQAKED